MRKRLDSLNDIGRDSSQSEFYVSVDAFQIVVNVPNGPGDIEWDFKGDLYRHDDDGLFQCTVSEMLTSVDEFSFLQEGRTYEVL